MRYGRLIVVGPEGKTRDKHECICDCGNAVFVALNSLRCGNTKSCGCLSSELSSARFRKHGGKGTSEYTSWQLMKDRCYNKNNRTFSYYGGRGVRVCDQWVGDFLAFISDMGNKPDPSYSIDRIDGDGDYTPDNCKWSSKTDQVRNRRNTKLVEYNGETKPLAEWCEILKLDYAKTNKRLWRNWSAERAFKE